MKNSRSKSVIFAITLFTLTILADVNLRAQTARPAPEKCVAAFCLGGDEAAAKTKLQGFSPRYDNPLHQPKYFFYNEYGNQVMSVTGYSKERPYLIVGIEAFAVDDSYQTKHFQMKDTAAFTTESGFFIGLRPSTSSMIFGIPNETGPKEVIKKKGQPDFDQKPDKFRIVRYKLGETEKSSAPMPKNVKLGSYTAEYRFYKNNLRHFIIALDTNL